MNINADGTGEETVQAKEKPIWLSDATSLITTNITTSDTSNSQVRRDQELVLVFLSIFNLDVLFLFNG